MTILIVDDEELLREKIQSVLEKARLSVREYYLAANAFDAIRILDEQRPDIVLSDIRMPSKNGLELAEYVHQSRPQTPVILLTGYSDFAYAQAAVKSHVFEYLLKPVDADKLVACVARAQKKLELYEKHERMYELFQEYFKTNFESVRRQYIESLLFSQGGGLGADENRELFRLDFSAYRLVAVSCGTALDSGYMEERYYCTWLVEKFIRELLPDAVTYISGNLVFFLWESANADRFTDGAALLALLARVLSYARQSFFGTLSAGISQVSNTLEHIQRLRRQVSECLGFLQENGRAEFLFYEDIMDAGQDSGKMETEIQKLTAAVRSGSRDAALRQFDQVGAELAKTPPEYTVSTYLLLVSNVSFLLHERKLEAGVVQELTDRILPQLRVDNLPLCAQTLRDWLAEVCDRITTEFQSRSNVVVAGVLDFIAAHFGEPVGLTDASRFVNRTPPYVSRLIKEITGENFTQLLTQKRMQEAKKLLKETSLRLADIAERVGYVNVRYFNRVFRASVNMSAGDYRRISAAFD